MPEIVSAPGGGGALIHARGASVIQGNRLNRIADAMTQTATVGDDHRLFTPDAGALTPTRGLLGEDAQYADAKLRRQA